LFWGTISPRRIWHASTLNFKFQPSVLKTLVETKEWHALLAARNILVDEQYSNDNDNGLKYKYWKWHGFLCRYAEYRHDNKNAPNKKEVLLLIHGFGASSSQWKGTMEALQHSNMVMAPDLIGFGQSEKPPLSYTQYLWESYILAFGKEIGKDWESFVVGGNSIGGYTAMAVAASDVAVAGKDVSSSGATGSNKCSGVVLMNSAGQILSREDIADTDGSSTVAKITSADALPKCR
jgi:pimeloyl-ACP methyl ester carboxylesterase